MSGIYSLTRTPHTRVVFLLDNSLEVCYNDVRNFGTMKVAEQADLDKKLKELGPDMLNDPCDYNEFVKKWPEVKDPEMKESNLQLFDHTELIV